MAAGLFWLLVPSSLAARAGPRPPHLATAALFDRQGARIALPVSAPGGGNSRRRWTRWCACSDDGVRISARAGPSTMPCVCCWKGPALFSHPGRQRHTAGGNWFRCCSPSGSVGEKHTVRCSASGRRRQRAAGSEGGRASFPDYCDNGARAHCCATATRKAATDAWLELAMDALAGSHRLFERQPALTR